MPKVITVPRPEGGAEHTVVWYRHHGCKNAKTFRSATNDPDLDLLQFPVGLTGFEMPMGVPFVVESSNACPVCGVSPAAWFQWQLRLIVA